MSGELNPERLSYFVSKLVTELNKSKESSSQSKYDMRQLRHNSLERNKNVFLAFQVFSENIPKEMQSFECISTPGSTLRPPENLLYFSTIEKKSESASSSLNLFQQNTSAAIEVVDLNGSTIEKFSLDNNQSVFFYSDIRFTYYKNLAFIQCRKGSQAFYSSSEFYLTQGDSFVIGNTEVKIDFDDKLRPELVYKKSSGKEACLIIKKNLKFSLTENGQNFNADDTKNVIGEIFKPENETGWRIRTLIESPCIWKPLYKLNICNFDYSLPLLASTKHTYRFRSAEFKVKLIQNK